MKKIYYLSLLLLLTISPFANASHLYGGELLYTHIAGNTYRVTVVLYGDCGSSDSLVFKTLKLSTPEINVYDAAASQLFTTINLPIDTLNSDIEVTPVCPAQINNTKCKSPNGTLPGIKKYTYHDTITLPHQSSEWRFIFNGYLYYGSNPPTVAGRTLSINNIVFGQGYPQVMYLIAKLNNLNGPNNSPVYNTVPTPFYCINIKQQYNQGASDPDGDSLSFELVTGLTSGNPIFYNFPYSPTYPLSADSFNYNNLNGQMTFTPNLLQRSLVVNEVTEYKNGILVGSSMREMTFIVLDNCLNQPPDGSLSTTGSNFVGGVHNGNNVINVCKGEPTVSFDIAPADPNPGDSVTLLYYNLPGSSTLTVNNNNSPAPGVHFNWNISTVATGIYSFYINYKDNGCPLSSNQTMAYTVQIVDNYSISADILSETQCHHRAAVRYTISNGILPRIVTVMEGSTIIKTMVDTTGTLLDSLEAGTYTVKVSSPLFACDTMITVVVPESGIYPVTPIVDNDLSLCIGDEEISIPVQSANGATLHWFDANGAPLPGPPAYSTGSPGTYTWYVSQQVSVCMSDTVVVHLRINENPEAAILNKAGKICYADRIYFVPSGGVEYRWTPALLKDEKGNEYAFITDPVTYTMICIDANGCKDTTEISYTEIEKCCQFAYPNAFTPNNDGKNDRFRPVMRGNMEEYDLSIYNRFGERVYHSKDPRSGWDGSYNGQLCDVGMYYFFVKAKCYTGQKEEHSDAFDLLR
jgi:gliding motility-associated-like protein